MIIKRFFKFVFKKQTMGTPALPGVFPSNLHSTYNLQAKLRTFPMYNQVPKSKFEANRVRGVSDLWSDIKTNKQTLQLRMYNYNIILCRVISEFELKWALK